MDDMFGMLYSNLPVERKLLTIVTNNMVDSLDTFLASSADMDLDVILQPMNGNTALHVSAQKGYHACVRRLLSARADPDKTNAFGFSPLTMSLRYDHIECVKILLAAGGVCSDTALIWMSQLRSEQFTWMGYTPELIEVLLKATPELSGLEHAITENLYKKFLRNSNNQDILRLFYKTGHTLPLDLVTDYMEREGRRGRRFIKEVQAIHSLRDCCRITIRCNLKPNVFYGEANLPDRRFPPTLRGFLLFDSSLD